MKLPSLVAFKIKDWGWESVWIWSALLLRGIKGWIAFTNSLAVYWVPPIVRRCVGDSAVEVNKPGKTGSKQIIGDTFAR